MSAFVVFAPSFPIATLGGGWQFGMTEATRAGLLGNPLTFTFGPFSSIYSSMYQPETDGLMIYGGLLLAVTATLGLLSLAGPGRWLPALGFSLFLPLVDMDAQLVAIPLLVLLLAYRVCESRPDKPDSGWCRVALPFMMPALGVLVLVKGTSAISAFAMVFLAAAMLGLAGKARLAGMCAVLFICAIPIFWLVSYQDLASLPAYFSKGLYIVTGYADAMSRPGPYWHIGVFFLACGFLYTFHLRRLQIGVSGYILLLGMAMLLFLGFKEGFVRHGGRHPAAALGIAVLVAWGSTLAGAHEFGRLRQAGLAVGVTVACWLAVTLTGGPGREVMRPYGQAPVGLYLRLFEPGYPRARFEQSLAKIRETAPLPALKGTTDVYSFSQAALIAAGLEWAPRPVLQSYSAYTPELLRADADHLTGPDAPRNVIFSVQPIDNRIPMLEDGNSWPLLLSLYQPVEVRKLPAYGVDAAILQRRQAPGSYELQPLSDKTYRFGERIALPQDAQTVLWAEIDVRPSLLGRVWGLLYKSPLLFMTYHFSGGVNHAFRYIYRMGETGFVLSPIVNNASDFIALPRGAPDAPRPEAVSLNSEGWVDWLWRPEYRVRLYRLTVSAD
ncbi:hypothetical protein J5J86_16740 [Aquabacter sp. L1I39]|uniref:hypothetical protein n=1 Tax=Aquabacter sp. L1I39 TaxID=2820278 RepID=UPI001ADC4F89|nr:hypothetical protein [Aquabacter sp. L1I39]QTL02431.1 hypothetical protein J5J86_16740 [Aquabacter sp. L1I39]